VRTRKQEGNGLTSWRGVRHRDARASIATQRRRWARSPVRHFRNDGRAVDELRSILLHCPASMVSSGAAIEMFPHAHVRTFVLPDLPTDATASKANAECDPRLSRGQGGGWMTSTTWGLANSIKWCPPLLVNMASFQPDVNFAGHSQQGSSASARQASAHPEPGFRNGDAGYTSCTA
jgi:hypothetical protein